MRATMVAEGADLIDIGGESTRPGAAEVSEAEELTRVVPAIEALVADGIAAPISIDTYKARVAEAALAAGAAIVNDVHGLQREPEIAAVAAQHGAPLIAMHWDKARDTGRDLIDEMRRYFDRHARDRRRRRHCGTTSIVLDPGFGFGKSLAENYELLRPAARTGGARLSGAGRHIAKIDDRPA